MANSIPNPTSAMLWFFIVTTIYFLLKINTNSKLDDKMYKGIYLMVVMIGEYFINLGLTESMCGVKQWQAAINYTVIPWFLIFGVLNMFLILFPDWLSPFSNTFGYGVTKLMGIGEFFETILKPKLDANKVEDKNLAEVLEHIYSDKSLLINEIKDGESFWETMHSAIRPAVQEPAVKSEKIKMLNYFLKIKNSVAEYVWYILTGFLVTSVSYNYIVNIGCKKTSKDMQLKQQQYHDSQVAKQLKEQEEKQKKIYYNYE
jgi:hypothetical protein